MCTHPTTPTSGLLSVPLSTEFPQKKDLVDSQFWTWLHHYVTLGKALALLDRGKWKGLDRSHSPLAVPTACELYVLWVLFPSIHWWEAVVSLPLDDNDG